MAKKKTFEDYQFKPRDYTKDYVPIESENLSSMSESELRKAIKPLINTANKRLKRLIEGETPSQVLINRFQRKTGLDFTEKDFNQDTYSTVRFSTAGKNQGQLQSLYQELYKFLTTKSSTKTGYKEVRSAVVSRMGFEPTSKEEESLFWSVYNRIMETPEVRIQVMGKVYDSGQVQRWVSTEIRQARERLYHNQAPKQRNIVVEGISGEEVTIPIMTEKSDAIMLAFPESERAKEELYLRVMKNQYELKEETRMRSGARRARRSRNKDAFRTGPNQRSR